MSDQGTTYTMTHKAIILAAGLGTRMRKSASNQSLTQEQSSVAAEGIKALIPIDRPFLDYSLSGLADAGIQSVCLVIGPKADQLRDYYSNVPCHRISISFAVQSQPLGTAHALASASGFAGDDPVLVLNSDNHYPVEALRSARLAKGAATIGFESDALIAKSNIPAERVAAYAVMQQDDEGYLKDIIEKPDAETWDSLRDDTLDDPGAPRLISMNCWRFNPAIFQACRSIDPSSRGEFEMADAVMYSIEKLDQRYQVIASDGGVLDLSHQEDIASVTRWLREVEVTL